MNDLEFLASSNSIEEVTTSLEIIEEIIFK